MDTAQFLEIESKVRKIIAQQAYVDDPRDVHDSDLLAQDLNFDSLDIAEAVMALEDLIAESRPEDRQSDPTIPDADVDQWKTVGDIIRYVATKTNVGGASAPRP